MRASYNSHNKYTSMAADSMASLLYDRHTYHSVTVCACYIKDLPFWLLVANNFL